MSRLSALMVSWVVVSVAVVLHAAPPAEPPAPAPTDLITVNVDSTKVLHTTDPLFSGINMCPFWNNEQDDEGSTKALSQMNMKMVRFPGGVPAEWYNWQHPEYMKTHMKPDDAFVMAHAGGAVMMFQTDACQDKLIKDSDSKRMDSTGDYAAQWAKYCVEKKIDVAYWEIGNEPEMDAPMAKSGQQDKIYEFYDGKFEEHAKAIKAAVPTAKIVGPAATNTYFWWAQHNLDKFMKAEGNKEGTGLVDAVSIHWYPEGQGDWAKQRGIPQGWAKAMNYITTTIAKYDSRPLPVFITEWNFAGGDHSKWNGTLMNALGDADCVGMFRQTGVAAQTYFVFQHIQGNWGLIADKGEKHPQHFAAPEYYAMTMTGLMGQEVLDTSNSADPKNVLSAYSAKSKEGGIQILLVNKCEAEQKVALQHNGKSLAGATARVYTLRGENGTPEDQTVIYNDVTNPTPSEDPLAQPKPTTLKPEMTIPPYSIALIVIGR